MRVKSLKTVRVPTFDAGSYGRRLQMYVQRYVKVRATVATCKGICGSMLVCFLRSSSRRNKVATLRSNATWQFPSVACCDGDDVLVQFQFGAKIGLVPGAGTGPFFRFSTSTLTGSFFRPALRPVLFFLRPVLVLRSVLFSDHLQVVGRFATLQVT